MRTLSVEIGRTFRRNAILLATATAFSLVAGAAPANAAILSFFGFSFSKNKYVKDALYYVDAAGDVIGLASLINPALLPAGAVLKTGAALVRILDPVGFTIISGRATIDLAPNETFLGMGWYGEFGANPLLPAPAVPTTAGAILDSDLQSGCNPLMLSCSATYTGVSNRAVFAFDWGTPGFTPTLNMNSSGHFNFAAVYTLAPDGLRTPFGLAGTRGDIAALGTGADSYMLCSSGYCGNVPEPQSWALFITGFGGIGAALRGRRRWKAAAMA